MQNFKSAFTMIELVFVIVVLGILAAVALPKLVASKNDATASTLAIELGDCIEMACGAYAHTGSFDIDSKSCDDVSVKHTCFILTTDDTTGIMNVRHTPDAPDKSVCKEAQSLVRINNLSTPDGVDHRF